MRVAVITDIHGNMPALEAVLGEIDSLGVDHVVCGGDLVGYGPQPDEVCATIAERGIPAIHGNYDHAIARDLQDCGCAYRDPQERAVGQKSVDWTLRHTSDASKAFLHALPFEHAVDLGGARVRVVHGSPRKVNEYLFEDKPASLYERLARDAGARVLAFGHTHKPWIREHGGVLFVNCGSVGKPKDGDPRAAFAVVESRNGDVNARIVRVDYDPMPVAAGIRAAGLPGELADRLVSGT